MMFQYALYIVFQNIYHAILATLMLASVLGYLTLVNFASRSMQQCVQQRQRSREEPCKEQQNNVFIKVHKSGSTTVANIFMRHAFKYHLSVMLPRGSDKVWLGWPAPFNKKDAGKPYMFSSRHEDYNLLAHHSVYDKKQMEAVMPGDTMYFAILREPFHNFKSAFRYYDVQKRLKIIPPKYQKSFDPIVEFLKNPDKYEKPYSFGLAPCSLTQNLMSADLGLDKQYYNNDSAIEEYILDIDRKFNLVLILEYLNESLILMRRTLCWKFRDIIYIPINIAKKKSKKEEKRRKEDKVSELEMRISHMRWSRADYKFYDYFNQTLWSKIAEQDNDFWEEVQYLKDVIHVVGVFCENNTDSVLHFDKTKWYDEFDITNHDCNLMHLTDMRFTKLLEKLYISPYQNPHKNPFWPKMKNSQFPFSIS